VEPFRETTPIKMRGNHWEKKLSGAKKKIPQVHARVHAKGKFSVSGRGPVPVESQDKTLLPCQSNLLGVGNRKKSDTRGKKSPYTMTWEHTWPVPPSRKPGAKNGRRNLKRGGHMTKKPLL